MHHLELMFLASISKIWVVEGLIFDIFQLIHSDTDRCNQQVTSDHADFHAG
jgi:hypothetical protein